MLQMKISAGKMEILENNTACLLLNLFSEYRKKNIEQPNNIIGKDNSNNGNKQFSFKSRMIRIISSISSNEYLKKLEEILKSFIFLNAEP